MGYGESITLWSFVHVADKTVGFSSIFQNGFFPSAIGKLGKLKKINFSPNNQTSIKSILSSESFYAGLFFFHDEHIHT